MRPFGGVNGNALVTTDVRSQATRSSLPDHTAWPAFNGTQRVGACCTDKLLLRRGGRD